MTAWVGEHKPLEDSVSITMFLMFGLMWKKAPTQTHALSFESWRKDHVDGDEGPSTPLTLIFASQHRQEAEVWWPSTPLVSTVWPGCSPRAIVLSLAFTQKETLWPWWITCSQGIYYSIGCMLRAESRKQHTASYRAFVGSSHKGVRNNQILNVILKVEPTGIVRELLRKMARG